MNAHHTADGLLKYRLAVAAVGLLLCSAAAAAPAPGLWKACWAKGLVYIHKNPPCSAAAKAMHLTMGDVAKLTACEVMGPTAMKKDSHCMQLLAQHPGAIPS
jgi:hypothetical protein